MRTPLIALALLLSTQAFAQNLRLDCVAPKKSPVPGAASVRGNLKLTLIKEGDRNHRRGGTPGAYRAEGELAVKLVSRPGTPPVVDKKIKFIGQYHNNDVAETVSLASGRPEDPESILIFAMLNQQPSRENPSQVDYRDVQYATQCK